jgi:hypothetical protein
MSRCLAHVSPHYDGRAKQSHRVNGGRKSSAFAALHAMYYNLVSILQTLKVTRANGRRRDLVDPLEAFETADGVLQKGKALTVGVGLHGQAEWGFALAGRAV